MTGFDAISSTGPVPPRMLPVAAAPWRIFVLAGLLLGAAVAVLFLFNPAAHSFYPYCGFYRLTGLLCPGCGALRATHQLLHGQFGAAYAYNPLYVVLLPLALFWFARMGWRKFHGKPVRFDIPTGWLWVMLAGLLLFTVLRNL